MKTLKFRPNLVPQILSKHKYATWRCFDEKNLTEGDAVTLINWETDEEFGQAVITKIVEKPYRQITDEDRAGHESLDKEQEIVNYKKYYGESWNLDTPVKIIYFDLM